MLTPVRLYSGRGPSVLTANQDAFGTFGIGQLRRLHFGPARMMARHHRWLLLLVPLYALAVGGESAWVLAIGLSASFIAYNVAVSVAMQRWPLWVAKSEVSLRCIEIALIYIALLSLREESLNSHYFLTSMYMLFVTLAAIGTGRRGALWTASCAALAATIYHTATFYEDPIIISLAGIDYSAGGDYWIAIALYAATLWCIYMGVGLLPSRARADETIGAHRERLATVGELTAQVVHGLSTPLTGITTIVDDLLEDCSIANRESLQVVKDEAERASDMVRELLHFSRRDANNPVVSLNEITQRALDLFSLQKQPADNAVSCELSPQPTSVRVGPSQLEQAILNLLDNARHAIRGEQDGQITLRTYEDGERVMLEVSDNGSGIPVEIQDRIFEPFFTTKEPGVGTGLGLAIVASVVRDCGGAISVQSKANCGSTFTISLQRSS